MDRRMARLYRWMAMSAVIVVLAFLLTAPALALETPQRPLDQGGIASTGGTIRGQVKFEGEQRPRRVIDTSSDAYAKEFYKDSPLLSEQYIFGDNDTLQNVFVYVSRGLEGKTFDPPQEPAVLGQIGCRFVPHVQGVVVNQTLEVRNGDATLHNVRARSPKSGSFNEGMPAKDTVMTKVFTQPEMAVPFKCDVHAWMSAYVHVMPHPYFAVTQQAGTFEIHGLPPGEYQLSVWHELPAFVPDTPTQTVQVQEGQTTQVTFTYRAKGK